jgi:CubicO group peptidase (beta-lactamase class C family)
LKLNIFKKNQAMLKFLRRLIFGLFSLILVLVLGLYLSGNSYLIRGIWVTYLHGETSATITDAKYFSTNTISATKPVSWHEAKGFNEKEISPLLQKYLDSTESIAYILIQNDSIITEKYWGVGSSQSQTNSFSMAKSITTMLVQIAIQKGIIASWDSKVINYLPELRGEYAGLLSLDHLAKMTAGLDWNEHYKNPFDITAQAYYSSDIESLMLNKVAVYKEPGLVYEYQSGATQLLALCLIKATGESLSTLTEEWLWSSMNAENSATWHLDSEGGKELAYCCFSSNARDFARFGKLLLNQGNWGKKSILDSTFVAESSTGIMNNFYGRSFWLYQDEQVGDVFYMRGILGQYIIVIPSHNAVMVRLGHHRLDNINHHPAELPIYLSESLKLLKTP